MALSMSRFVVGAGLAVMLFASFVAPAHSASRKSLLQPSNYQQKRRSAIDGFRVELRHVDHGKNLTKLERLQRAVRRADQRLQSFMSLAADTTTAAVKAPIHPGEGEFLMSLAIGTPSVPYSAIVDTGSDLIWTQCEPCTECYSQPTPIFNPSKSSSFSHLPCASSLCEALPVISCDDSDAGSSCTYTYEYGDYSSTSGALATETFTFSAPGSPPVSVPKIGFGCGYDNEGGGFDQGGGLVGLGRGPLSLVSQLDEPKFSYCLSSINDHDTSNGGTLLMGSIAGATNQRNSSSSTMVTTPLVRNSAQPSFYYLSLEGISIGGARLRLPKSTFTLKKDGSGGMIIDSGTTITYLEEKAYDHVRREFVKRIKLKEAADGSQKTGLDLCFAMPENATEVAVPTVVFHFEGADLALPPENYLLALGDQKEKLMCLAMGGADGMSVFGNIQQQNLLVLHDLKKESVSFLHTKCDGL